MADDPHSDRRRFRRVKAAKLVQYKHFDAQNAEERLVDELGMAQTLDISESGLAFMCSAPLPVAWGINLDLVYGDDIVSVEARIVSVRELEEGQYRIGTRFTEIKEEDRAKLRTMVSERSKPAE